MHGCVRIGLVDDHSIFRAGVIHALQASGNLMVVAEGETADDAIRIAGEPTLDILLLEIEVVGNCVEAARAIRQKSSKARIVILTRSDEEQLVVDALRAGAQGYILKDVCGADLIGAIELIHRGEPYITPALASRLLSRVVTQTRGNNLLPRNDLTARERQVLGHLCEGRTNREIAVELGISIKTIKQHMMLLFSKMGVRNRIEALARHGVATHSARI